MTTATRPVPNKGTVEYGAWNALTNSLKLTEEERILILSDEETDTPIGQAFYDGAVAITGDTNVDYAVLESLGSRPLTGLPPGLDERLRAADVTIYVAGAREGEIGFRVAMKDAALEGGARHGHGVGITEEIMLSGMQADIAACNATCADLTRRLSGIEWARVTAPSGTDVTLEFAPYVRWINSDWDFTDPEKRWGNLPSGEVFTWPFRTNGIIVVDGVLGDHFDQRYGSLAKTPITWEVRDNRIVDVDCPGNRDLEAEFEAYLLSSHNGNIMGEFGVGALGVDELVGRMVQDEKRLGDVHFSPGRNYHGETGAPDYGQTIHADGVVAKATLRTSRKDCILKRGVYQPCE